MNLEYIPDILDSKHISCLNQLQFPVIGALLSELVGILHKISYLRKFRIQYFQYNS